MTLSPWQNRGLGLLAGVAAVVLAVGWWPHAPLYATATDRHENFAICTGACDEGDLEAIFILDFATCQLKACVLIPINNQWGAPYVRDIRKDMQIDVAQSPKFLMVSGKHRILASHEFPRGCKSLLYVAELNSGKMIAYAVGKVNNGPVYLSPLASMQFRDPTLIRGGLLQGGAAALPSQ